MTAALTGFTLGLSLILAIGAQNAFVLRQGLQRAHVLAVVMTCALSDAVLIVAGVSGFGALAHAGPWVADALRWLGAAFLLVYGGLAFRSAALGTGALKATGRVSGSRRAAIVTCLAMTWLNPHVYLDTVVLLGSVAAQHEGSRVAFGAGAVTASFVFFFGLGYGARLLVPIFSSPLAWRWLDLGIGVIMWAIAIGLVLNG